MLFKEILYILVAYGADNLKAIRKKNFALQSYYLQQKYVLHRKIPARAIILNVWQPTVLHPYWATRM